MGYRKQNTDDTADKAKQEADEAAKAAKEAADKELMDKLADQQRELAEARERAAKAEGMAEGIKTAASAQPQQKAPEWTEEQWTAWEEKTGMKREGLAALDSVMSAKLMDINRTVDERVKKAEDRAKAAEDRYSSFEKNNKYETLKREYLSKKPQFSRYEKDFDEFVSEFPDEVKNDPKRLESLFNKAETYIKGKVGDKEMRRSHGGSERFGSDEHNDESNVPDADLADLRPHERMTVERILPTKEGMDKLKKYQHDLKGENGVMIDSRAEFDKYKK